ncbi:hypothetical protein [Prosthecobacter sp.]|uniref:hypothetical protein n=1 Tax=Prosthecobacter sp. TaxID=1965333 RepID=UPI0037845ECC
MMNKVKRALAGTLALGCFLAAASSPEPGVDNGIFPWMTATASEAAARAAAGSQADKEVFPRWSVVGEWRMTNPARTDVLTLKANGRVIAQQTQTTAEWALKAEGGTPMLVLRWNASGTESLAMVGPDHFRGRMSSGAFMDLRRGEEKAETKEAGDEME